MNASCEWAADVGRCVDGTRWLQLTGSSPSVCRRKSTLWACGITSRKPRKRVKQGLRKPLRLRKPSGLHLQPPCLPGHLRHLPLRLELAFSAVTACDFASSWVCMSPFQHTETPTHSPWIPISESWEKEHDCLGWVGVSFLMAPVTYGHGRRDWGDPGPRVQGAVSWVGRHS